MAGKTAAVIVICVLALVLLGTTGGAQADLIVNGGFESYTSGSVTSYPNGDLQYSPVTGWSSPALDTAGTTTGNLLFTPGSADKTGAYYYNTGVGGPSATIFTLWGPNNGSNNGLPATSPAGGNFLALDADSDFSGALSQTVTGLTPGQQYQLGFWWGGAQLSTTFGATTEQLQVSFGSQTQFTSVLNNASKGFTGWQFQTMTFTADGTSDTLSFLALGTPSGLPPFVVLDGVTLNAAPVPEPSTVVLVSVGLLGIGVVRRLRRRGGAEA